MKKIFFILICAFLSACGKPKSVLICGDHVCVNKAEAEQYFKENLSLEVKIIDKKNPKNIDLIELNLNSEINSKKKISIVQKNKTNKKLKVLSKKEIKDKKKKLKKANKDVKKPKQKLLVKKPKKNKKNIKSTKVINNQTVKIPDICTILEKCSIDEISKYLVKQGNEKKFPDITIREK